MYKIPTTTTTTRTVLLFLVIVVVTLVYQVTCTNDIPCGSGTCPENSGCCVWKPAGSQNTINQCYDKNLYSCTTDNANPDDKCLCGTNQHCCSKACYNPTSFQCTTNYGNNGETCLCTHGQGCCNGQCYDLDTFHCLLADNKPGKRCLCQLNAHTNCNFNYMTDHQTCYNNQTDSICPGNGQVIHNTQLKDIHVTIEKINDEEEQGDVCQGSQSHVTLKCEATCGNEDNGDKNYNYVWTTSDGGIILGSTTMQTVTAKSTGKYTCTVVVDECPFSATKYVTVNPSSQGPISVTINSTPNPPTTCNKQPVTLTCTATSQNAVQYQWIAYNGGSIPSGSENSQTIVVSNSGEYKCIATDQVTSCSATDKKTVTINQLSASIVPPSSSVCSGGSTTLTCYASGSSGPSVTYSWTTANGGTISGATNTQSVVATSSGKYICSVCDGDCTASAYSHITIGSLTTHVTPDNSVLCEGDKCDATLTCNTNGANGAVQYAWTATNGGVIPSGDANKMIIKVNKAGTYTCTATDNSCTNSDSAVVTKSTLEAEVTPCTANVCTGNDVELTCKAKNANGPVQYQWTAYNGGQIDCDKTTKTIRVNKSGTYKCTVSDGQCSASSTGQVTVGSGIDVNVTPKPCSICDNDGEVELTCKVTGSDNNDNNFDYKWTASNGGRIDCDDNKKTIKVKKSGKYTCTVRTSGGCSDSDSTFVNVGSALSVNVKPSTTTVTKCEGDSNFSGVELKCEVNNAHGQVKYSWVALNGGHVDSNDANKQKIRVNKSGTYKCIATDDYCTKSDTGVVTVNNSDLKVEVTPCTASVCGYNGQVELTCKVSHANGPVRYSWKASNGGVITCDNDNMKITVNKPGTYTCTVTDSSCSKSDSAVVTRSELNASIEVLEESCASTKLKCKVSGSANNVIYSWKTIGGDISGPSNTEIITATKDGIYFCTVVDQSGGCSDKATRLVNVKNEQIGRVTITTKPDCGYTCAGDKLELECCVSGNDNGLSYSWTAMNGGKIEGSANRKTIRAESSGDYKCTVSTSSNSPCSGTKSETKSITISSLKAHITPSGNVETCREKQVFTCNATGAKGNVNYLWTASNGGNILGNVRSQSITATCSGRYTCKVQDSICSDTESVTLDTTKCEENCCTKFQLDFEAKRDCSSLGSGLKASMVFDFKQQGQDVILKLTISNERSNARSFLTAAAFDIPRSCSTPSFHALQSSFTKFWTRPSLFLFSSPDVGISPPCSHINYGNPSGSLGCGDETTIQLTFTRKSACDLAKEFYKGFKFNTMHAFCRFHDIYGRGSSSELIRDGSIKCL